MKSLGLDLSTTRTGCTICTMQGDSLKILHRSSIEEEGKGINRAHRIAARVADVITIHEPDIVVIEGYGYANKFSLVTLVELGTLVRWAVLSSGRFYLDPSPNSLKKFVSGKGNTEKDKMMLAVYKRWGIEAANNDEADAIGLAAMGLAYLNAMKVSVAEKEILASCKKHSLARAQ